MPCPLSVQFGPQMFVVYHLLVIFHVVLSLAEPLASIYNFSELNCTSMCGLPFEQKWVYSYRPGASVSSEKSRSVNLGGRCAGESQLSIGNWKQSVRPFLQLIDMKDTSFNCPKWNRAYREPDETELPWFSTNRPLEFLYSGKSFEYNLRFKTSVVEPDGIRGHCNITIDRGVIEPNIGVHLMGTELQYGGYSLKTIGSIVSLWHERKLDGENEFEIRPFQVHLQRDESNGCRGKNCPVYEMM